MIIALQALIFFRESLLNALDRILRPYYKRLSLSFVRSGAVSSDDEECEEQVFSEFDDERGVIFYPPMYAQRYAAVIDSLMDERWCGKLEKVAELGYHDMSFIKYLQGVPGVKNIMGVDIENTLLHCSSEIFKIDITQRENPLKVTLFQGNAADPDYRLIGCDAVVSIEMIEHMMPHDLERLIHTIFGFIKPWVVVLTTPNGDFNVLFKNLEENGLRRMDHYFEWSREQFNDWCSNIILRYPQYTVSCKGIGPGPPSTEHIGCCSQLALFVAKDYHKQQDLNINSLALVTNTPIEDNICDIIESWEPVDADNMLCNLNSFESYPEFYFSNKNSCVSILMPSPTYSIESIELQDKTLQCDLDIEQGKNFLMFDDEMYRVMIPRKNCHNIVYEIQDVFSRLNCTTLQVKKFSKETQNLMAQHKDSLATREVMQEILNLTKMLNLNKGSVNESTNENIWCNINWGDNAPYWNKYYKVIREYNHPFEDKCEDIRILDLISDEINRLVDNEFDEESFVDADKVEVPIEYLMRIVEHITDDVDKVKELLEWNGYEVVDNIVIHSRLAIDKISNDSKDDDWNDNDSLSDSYIDRTDLHCKIIADGTTLDMDHNARHLHRALDCKVRKIRKMLSADEDIATEINKVMRRLMKLALNNGEDCSNPPTTQWIHRKLLELLTLTEKAIVQRQRNFERSPIRAIIDFVHKVRLEDIATIDKICKDDTGKTVVDRYSDLISEDQKEEYNVKCHLESDFEDNVSVPVQLIKNDQTIIDKVYWPNLHIIDETFLIIERNQVWEEDNEINSFLNNNNFEHVGDTDYKLSKTDKNNYKERQSDLHENIHDKEIPKSLIELSNPELNVRKNSENSIYSRFHYNSPIENNFLSNIAATEENFLIDIIMVDRQETIALRRSIGTDVVDDQETLVRSISGHIKLNSINGEKEIINVRLQSQTLFLDDINEPSTSRGIRHNSINMQCGPDTVRDFSVLSTTTSFHEIPKLNSLIGVKEYENSLALETFTNDNGSFNTILIPRIKSIGIHIRDSETKISDMSNNLHAKAFVSQTRDLATLDETCTLSLQYKETLDSQNVLDNDNDQKKSLNIIENGQILEINKQSENRIGFDTNYCTPTIQTDVIDKHMEMQAETTLLKPASSDFKSVDSISDFNASVDSRKTPSRSFLFRIPSSLRSKTSISKDVQKFNSYRTRLHLSCGGVHVHSYNNKKVSEDVIYHGEWKKYVPKVKKTAQCRPVLRRGIETKHKNIKTDCEKITTAFSMQKEIMAMNRKLKLDIYKNTQQTSSTKKVTHLPIVNKPKVTSKIKMSIVSSKTKISHKVKNPLIETPKEIENNRNFITKSYIPPYLKRNLEKMKQSKLKDVTQNLNEIRTIIKVNKQQKITSDKSCKNKMEIRKELLKLDISPRKNKSYLVFCNETRNKNDPFIVKSEINSTSILQNNMDSSNKHFNTLSQNSSTCSSPNSVTTVKLAAKRSKSCKTSGMSCQSRIENNLLVNTTTVNKKIITGIKNNNIGIDNDFNDKENVPQTSGQFYKDVGRKSMNSFIRKHKSVYVAQIKKGSSSTINSHSKHNTLINKSINIKIPAIDSSYTVLKAVTASSTPQKSPIPSEYLLINENKEQNSNSKSHNLNMVLRAKTQILKENLSTNNYETAIVKECYNVLKSRLECFDNKITASQQNVATEMQHLVYDILKHVDISYNENNAFDSETVILSREDISPEDSLASSYKTVIPADYINTMIDSSFKNSLNNTLDSTVGNESIISLPDTTLTMTDFDSFSCKSISDSRFSEYFLADNELSSSYQDSLRDIFERKDKMSSVNSPGALAVQIFSGFSLDAEPIAGDRPDSINLIDSETGSAAVETQRQATSEEILVSGRSSESYESCVLDEDSVVPDWLFRIISYQQHIDEDEEGNEFMIPEPLILPIIDPLDTNNVEVEPVLGVGAGDGRGMHSDNSQDSSGRGTSLSSTDSSSGQQSEITLINPFTGQIELLSESVDSAVVNPCIPGTTENALGSSEGASASNTHRGSSGSPTLLATSDFDADISSLETDVLDSSDN